MVPLLKITLQNVLCQTQIGLSAPNVLENEMRAALLTGKRFVSLYFFNYCSSGAEMKLPLYSSTSFRRHMEVNKQLMKKELIIFF